MLNLAKKYLKPEIVELLKNSKGEIAAPKLLTGNTKLDKGEDIVLGLAMLPELSFNNYLKDGISAANVCPTAKLHGCDKVCIGLYSGHYSMARGSAHKAQIKRALMFHFDRETFDNQLIGELASVAGLAYASSKKANIRLDVFSDNKKENVRVIKLASEKLGMLYNSLSFYDYTKIPTMDTSTEYGKQIALSVSKNSLGGKLYRQYKDNLKSFNYSAIVVPPESVKETIEELSKLGSISPVNGDLFDNFTKWGGNNKKHTVLVLKGKGSKTATKERVSDTFAISPSEAFNFYQSIFNSI